MPGTGHIFLSHAGADTPAARQFAEVLRRNGLEVWFDKDKLPAGDAWMATLEEAIASASAMIVYIGRSGIQAWVDREVRFGLVRNTNSGGSFRFIPVLGEGAETANLPPFVQQQQCVDLRDAERAPEQIRRLIEVLQNQVAQAAVRSEYWSAHSPFRSLQVFSPEDSWLFFGRDHDTDELLTRLSRAPALAVIGNSGSGKSSLIQAGLIPALRRGRFRYNGKWTDSWRTAVFRPSVSPFDYLAETLPGQLAPELSPVERAEFVDYCKKKLPEGGEALRNAIAAIAGPLNPTADGTRVLLVADQFEELFTLVDDKETRNRYIAALLAAARLDSAVPVHLVLALRADFYSHCLDHPNLSAHLDTNLYNVPLVSPPQLREAIQNRLALAGGRAETGLVDSLLADVGAEPGNLALLEHALSQLWDKCGGSGSTLTSNAYTDIGRLKGALGRHADEVYRAIGDKDDQHLVQRIFLELVQLSDDAQDTRRRVPKKELLELGAPEKVERLIADLASNRLLTTSGQGPQSPSENFVEVSHEALIREWPTLREWLKDNREDLHLERILEQAAEEWDELKRDPGALLQGGRFVRGWEWLGKHQNAHGLLREFLTACHTAQEEAARKEREAQERELARQEELRQAAEARAKAEETAAVEARRSAARSRWFSYALAALFLLSGVFVFFWYRSANEKLRMAREIESDALASLSRSFNDDDRIRALMISLYALQTVEKRGTIEAVQDAVQRVVAPLAERAGSVTGIAAQLDGKVLAAAWEDGSISLLEPGSSKQQGSDPAHVYHESGAPLTASGKVSTLSISGKGKWLAAAGNRPDIDVWELASRRHITLPFPAGAIKSIGFDPSESDLVVASWDSGVVIQSLKPGSAPKPIPNSAQAWQALFNPVGRMVGIALARGAVAIVAPESGTESSIAHQSVAVKSLDISLDGKRLAFGDSSGLATILALDTRKEQKPMTEESGIDRTLFSPDGKYLVTMNSGGSATVWDASTGEKRMRLSGKEPFRSAAFARFGDTPHVAFGTANGSKGGRLLIYDLDVNHLRNRAHEIWLENNSPALRAEDCRSYLHRETCPPLKWAE